MSDQGGTSSDVEKQIASVASQIYPMFAAPSTSSDKDEEEEVDVFEEGEDDDSVDPIEHLERSQALDIGSPAEELMSSMKTKDRITLLSSSWTEGFTTFNTFESGDEDENEHVYRSEAIAQELGIAPSTVINVLEPETAEQHFVEQASQVEDDAEESLNVDKNLLAQAEYHDTHHNDAWTEPAMNLNYQMHLEDEAAVIDPYDQENWKDVTPTVSGMLANEASGVYSRVPLLPGDLEAFGEQTSPDNSEDENDEGPDDELLLRALMFERFRPAGRRMIRLVRPAVASTIRREERMDQFRCDPNGAFFTWMVFIIVALMNFGNFINYDMPSALNGYIKDSLDIQDTQLSYFYVAYTIPNAVFCLYGGYICDSLGLRISAVLFLSVTCTGLTIVSVGSWLPRDLVAGMNLPFVVMIIGRLIYAMGAESSFVTGDSILADYFNSKRLRIAMPIASLLNNTGDFLAFLTLPILANYFGAWQYAVMCVIGVAYAGLIATYCFVFIDLYWESGERARMIDPVVADFKEIMESVEGEDDTERAAKQRSLCARFWTVIKAPLDVFQAGPLFWLLSTTAAFFTSVNYSFTGFATAALESRWKMDQVEASRTTGVVGMSMMVAIPVISLVLHPRSAVFRAGVLAFMALMQLGAMIGLIFLPISTPPFVLFIVEGVAVAALPALVWPCLPSVVPGDLIGQGYGTLYAMQNLLNGISYFVVGNLSEGSALDPFYYFWIPVSFLTFLCSITFAIATYRRDRKKKTVQTKQYRRLSASGNVQWGEEISSD